MCRFYGLKPSEIASLEVDDYQDLWLAISQIEAQEILVNLGIVTYPHMRKEDREEYHRKHYKIAYPDNFEKNNPSVTLAQLAKAMNNLGNG